MAETVFSFTLSVIVLILMGTAFGPWLAVQIFGDIYVELTIGTFCILYYMCPTNCFSGCCDCAGDNLFPASVPDTAGHDPVAATPYKDHREIFFCEKVSSQR